VARGFVWATYIRDNGEAYAKQVDAELATESGRGWDQTGPPDGHALFPRAAKPRMVFGVSQTTGRRNYTIVAHTGAPLWTGDESIFRCETNDQTAPWDFYTVTRRRGESWPVPGARPPMP
jgi:hypothetical protein